MRKFTFKFELFGKKAEFNCEAFDREHADEQFASMLKRHTTLHSVTDELKEPRKPKEPRRGSFPGGIEDIFSSFGDIFDKNFPFGKK